MKFAFIGGDKRQLFAADKLLREGHAVSLAGFDKLYSLGFLSLDSLETALENADAAVLPITGVKNGVIPAHFSDKEIKIDNNLIESLGNIPVFMGKASTFPQINAVDLLSREEFSVANAQPTAEGAVLVAMENYPSTILGSRCLVVGYGRIGSLLSRMLRSLGAKVTVATTCPTKAEQIKADSNTAVRTGDLKTLDGFDIVFNTADSLVLGEKILRDSSADSLIIDLASGKGGADFKAAERLGFTAIHALALPGRYSPQKAGEIISDTILRIIKEEFCWQI